jgi:predicted nucleic acid-binding protein
MSKGFLIDTNVLSEYKQAAKSGRPLPVVDSLIAATALSYDLTIVTRNVRDFESAGASTLNPWQS